MKGVVVDGRASLSSIHRYCYRELCGVGYKFCKRVNEGGGRVAVSTSVTAGQRGSVNMTQVRCRNTITRGRAPTLCASGIPATATSSHRNVESQMIHTPAARVPGCLALTASGTMSSHQSQLPQCHYCARLTNYHSLCLSLSPHHASGWRHLFRGFTRVTRPDSPSPPSPPHSTPCLTTAAPFATLISVHYNTYQARGSHYRQSQAWELRPARPSKSRPGSLVISSRARQISAGPSRRARRRGFTQHAETPHMWNHTPGHHLVLCHRTTVMIGSLPSYPITPAAGAVVSGSCHTPVPTWCPQYTHTRA